MENRSSTDILLSHLDRCVPIHCRVRDKASVKPRQTAHARPPHSEAAELTGSLAGAQIGANPATTMNTFPNPQPDRASVADTPPQSRQKLAFWAQAHLCASLLLISLPMTAADSQPIEATRGATVFAEDFQTSTGSARWTGPGEIVESDPAQRQLRVERTASGGGAAMHAVDIDPKPWRGCLLTATARIRGEGITDPPRPWNGVKFMLEVTGPGGKSWPAATLPKGTFDWQRAGFTARIPIDATGVRLYLGLEAVTGRAWFDDIKVVVRRAPAKEGVSAPPMSSVVRTLPRSRGAMVGGDLGEEGLKVLGSEWGANLIRWQLIRFEKPGQSTPLAAYPGWLEAQMKRLDDVLRICARHGLRVVVDLHSPPGGRGTVSGYVGSDGALFTDRSAQDLFVSGWETMARRYRGNRQIWGFDLANEPVEGWVEADCDDWPALATRAARAVEAIDPDRVVIVEPNDWGGPDAIQGLEPLPVSNVVYSVHMYVPMAFTHQGVFEQKPPVDYPGAIEGRRWDRAALAEVLAPVVTFQKRHGVRIYIGEFSAIRWAPAGSGERYLRDVISLFEEQGWDWSYHAFREWQGWSVEHGDAREDAQPSKELTGRGRLLKEMFELNGVR